MTPAERERATKYLEKTRESYLHTARRLSREQLQYKPAPDRWSVAEALEHIIIVERRVLGVIETTVQQAPNASQNAFEDEFLVRRIAGRVDRFKGPHVLMPTGQWPVHQLPEEFEAVRRRSFEFTASTKAELRQHGFPHPIFGELNCYQWLLLIPAHCERHLAQAAEVMAEPGFPRAAAV
jgi:uncharacterized damage-inducible protein DinB